MLAVVLFSLWVMMWSFTDTYYDERGACVRVCVCARASVRACGVCAARAPCLRQRL